ncbi:MAG TPA: alpha/beta family hydrolase, partial [Actinomycetes bacterium]
MTAAGEPLRLRLPLRQPQAVEDTTALQWEPAGGAGQARPGVVLAPGAGSQVTGPSLCGVAAGLAARGHPVLAFNFAYAERRRPFPDPPARLESAWRDAVAFALARLGGPLVLGGRSMGGRIATHLAAAGERCAGLALLAYPLHPPGRPQRLRTDHWPRLTVPVLFVQGDHDELCDLDLLEWERRGRLGGAPSRLHLLRGADHEFQVPGRDRD